MSQQPAVKTPWMVVFALFGALAIFVVSTAVIYYSFITTPETNCGVVLHGNQELDQAIVRVNSVTRIDGEARNLQVTLDQAGGYSARFFLSSGTYRVSVIDAHGVSMIDETVFIPPGVRRQYDASKASPTTRPRGIEASQPS